jgi:hypothetical protein
VLEHRTDASTRPIQEESDREHIIYPDPPAERLLEAARQGHHALGEALIDLRAVADQLAEIRRDLSVAVVSYDSGAVTELPDDPHHGPRD